MAETTRQFQGTRTPEGGINVTPVEPVDESKRHMVKFNKKNPVHNELIRSIGEEGQPWHRGTMKQDLDKIMIHSGGYFSFPKEEAPQKTESKPKISEAVAKPKAPRKARTTKPAPKPVEAAKPILLKPGQKPAPKKSGGIWSDYEAKARAAAEETAKKQNKKK